jgi:hypothetical protein
VNKEIPMTDSNSNDGALNESDLDSVSGGGPTPLDYAQALGEVAWIGLKWVAKKVNELGQALQP